jgi:hypothetical protein
VIDPPPKRVLPEFFYVLAAVKRNAAATKRIQASPEDENCLFGAE